MAKIERPRWRVNETSFIGHALVNEGDEVIYTPTEDGGVSKNLSPLNATAQALLDQQKADHPDKTEHADKRAAKAAAAEDEDGEDEDGLEVMRPVSLIPETPSKVVDADKSAAKSTKPLAKVKEPGKKGKPAAAVEEEEVA